MELRLCQIIKKILLYISLESLSKTNLQIFRWESQRGSNLVGFLELGNSGDRSYLAEDSRREYYLQSKSSPLQVMCIILRKSPPLGNPCLQTWPAEK